MRDLQQRLGMSILLITHDLGVVAEMCKDVCVMYAGQIVERADVLRLFRSPQHPYTEGLLHSIPQLGMSQTEKLAVIRGVVPNPLNWPAGCRFAPRCDYRFEKCEKQPPMFAMEGQESACWLCEQARRVAPSTAFVAPVRAPPRPAQPPAAHRVRPSTLSSPPGAAP